MIRRSIVSQELYERIKQSIFAGEWAPGERIDRKALAARFGISQTPVNDALNRLTGEGLVESRQRDGYFVPDYGDRELADLFALRAGVESIAARLCAEEAAPELRRAVADIFAPFSAGSPPDESAYLEADRAFHAAVIRASGSARIAEAEASLGATCRSYEHGLVRPPSATLPEHRAIADAILRADGPGAQLAMSAHLLKSRAALLAQAESAGRIADATGPGA